MGKVQYYTIGVALTLALAIPAALLALAVAAFLDLYVAEIASTFMTALRVDWQAFASTRWPELAGMVIGQLLLMAILLMGRARALADKPEAA
jgi:hypothetical protein